MNLVFLEATNGFNWGKFAIGRFDGNEWAYPSKIDTMTGSTVTLSVRLLRTVGWGPDHFFFLDLQTGEGAIFRHGGYAEADLNKHRIWVCPMALPALRYIMSHPLDELPELLELTEAEAPSAMQGYRRAGEQAFCVEFV